MQFYFEDRIIVEKSSHKMEKILKVLIFRRICVIISSARKNLNEIKFSGKDELMGNLRAAALACGVVASVLGGGFGVAYLTSSTVSTADLVTEENTDDPVVGSSNASATASTSFAVSNEKTTTYNRTTTKKSYTAENTTAASKFSMYTEEGTTSQYKTEAATAASRISRSVPAPAHAPAALTQPSTQAATTAAKVAMITATDVKVTTTAYKPVVTTAIITTAATTTTTVATTTTTAVTTTAAPEPTTTYVEVTEEPEVWTEVEEVSDSGSLPISDEEYIILCNAVAHEAGCSWISETDKAYVVEVIMNRVNSPKFPNTIYDVLTQPGQFSGSYGYVNLGTYSSYVTQSVKDAVTLYFTEPESFTQGYIGFWGDGYRNHFS